MGIQEWLFVLFVILIVFPWLVHFAFWQSITVVHIFPAFFLNPALDKASRPWSFLFFDPVAFLSEAEEAVLTLQVRL